MDEVLTAVPTADALKLAEIQAMRQLADAVSAQSRQHIEQTAVQTRALEKLAEKVDDVRERVISLESSGYDKRLEALKVTQEKTEVAYKAMIEKLENRVNQLESERDQVKGAASFWTWLTKNAPWLLAGVAAFAAGLGIKFTK